MQIIYSSYRKTLKLDIIYKIVLSSAMFRLRKYVIIFLRVTISMIYELW